MNVLEHAVEGILSGHRFVKFIRNGVELIGRPRPVMGDVVSLPAFAAKMLVMNSAAVFVTEAGEEEKTPC